jgi:hypothetical protein
MGIQVSRNLEVQAIVTTFHRRKKPQISAYLLVTLEVHHSKKAPSVPLVHPGPNPRGSVRRFTVYIDDESLWLREERRRRRSYALHQHVQLGLNEQEQRARAGRRINGVLSLLSRCRTVTPTPTLCMCLKFPHLPAGIRQMLAQSESGLRQLRSLAREARRLRLLLAVVAVCAKS